MVAADGLPNSLAMLDVARSAARDAGQQVRDMFDRPRTVTSKGRRDVVTDADLAAQDIITGRILGAFPDHGFLAEEPDSRLPADGPIIWIIDPIDGTTNYSRGVPLYCVSIAALENTPPLTIEQVRAAVVYDPVLDEMFTATPHAPGLLERQGRHRSPLRVSEVQTLDEAVVGIDLAYADHVRQQGLDHLNQIAHDVNVVRGLGAAALALAWVAAGRLDAYVHFRLRAWDVAAAALIVHNAGGAVVGARGETLVFDAKDLTCLATNARLLPQLLPAARQAAAQPE